MKDFTITHSALLVLDASKNPLTTAQTAYQEKKMKELLENAANIISEAAKSPLGIAALLAIVIGAIALAFFQDAPVILKGISFALVIGFFFVLARASFTYRTDTMPEESGTISQAADSSSGSVDGEWIAIDGPDCRHLQNDERAVLELMRGKPDVHWTESLINAKVKKLSVDARRPISIVLADLVAKQFLIVSQSGAYSILPSAIEYYRSTGDRQAIEIDEAEYWDGA